jgi:hypothetical protein
VGGLSVILTDDATREEFLRTVRPLLGWTQREPDVRTERLERILSTVEAAAFPGALLPVHLREPSRIAVYAIADKGTAWRKLQPLLLASVGMTLTDFDGRTVSNLADNGLEGELKRRSLTVARFEAPPAITQSALNALTRLVNLTAQAPEQGAELLRTTSQLLHAFDLAIAAGNADEAGNVLELLRQRQQLDTLNLYFLQVRLFAEFLEWERLAEVEWFQQLALTRRPASVTAAMVKALYHQHLAPLTAESVEIVLRTFRENVLRDSGTLFASLPRVRSAAVSVAFLLHAIVSENETLTGRLQDDDATEWDDETRDLFARCLAHARADAPPVAAPQNELAEIIAALQSGAVKNKLELLAMLDVAGDVGTLAAENVVLEIAERIEVDAAEDVLPPDVEVPATRLPETWVDWFQLLPEMPHATARRIAQQAADEWPVLEQLATTAEVERLVEAASACASDHRASIAIPHLIRWVQKDEYWPNPDLRKLYEDLYTTLILSSQPRPDTLQHSLTMLDALLSLGSSPQDYGNLVSGLLSALPSYAAVNTIDLLLDASELLVSHPGGDNNLRNACWTEVVAIMRRFAAFLSPAQRAMADELGAAYGLLPELPVAATAQARVAPNWQGRIGIYTLRDDAGQRAQALLQRLYPGSTIQLNNDHVATAALRQLAESADVLVVNWTSAKHAATDAIKRARPQGFTWAPGGASSIVAKVAQAIEELIRS